MKIVAFFSLLVCLSIPFSGEANSVTFIKEYTYDAGDADSKLSCRTVSLIQVKRLLLEELGTYLEAETNVANFELTKDQVTTITAGFVKTEIISEKWNGQSYWLKAQIEADPEEVVQSIGALRNDLNFETKLKEMQKANVEALERILELKAELQALQENMLQMNQDYQTAKQISDALKWYETGQQLAQEDRYREARTAFDNAIALNPNCQYYFARGRMYQKQKQYRRAVKDFDIVIGLDADFAKPYFFRGKALLKLGQADQGLEDIEKAAGLGYGWASKWLEERKRHED